MDDVTLILTVSVIAIGSLAGIAYLLDRRRKASGAVGPELPEIGPVGRVLLWIIRGLVVVMVLSAVGLLVFEIIPLVYVAAGCLAGYLIVGYVFRIVRLAGK
jgi:hypothetical protein